MYEVRNVLDEWASVEAPPPPAVRSISLDPKKTALLLLDFLREVCTDEFRPRAAAALPKLKEFLERARKCDVVVVHTVTSQGAGSLEEFADALKPIKGERIYSAQIDKFYGTDLESYLRGCDVDTVIIAGTSPNGCVLFTMAGALLRGFRPVVPVDGMPANTTYQEQFVAWHIANAGGGFSKSGVLTRLDEILFL